MLLEDLRMSKKDLEKAAENIRIFKEVIDERRRFLRGSYLMKGQDDLELILETLYDHFKLIQLTSFEELARNNQLNLSVTQIMDKSNVELHQLLKTLELLQMDEEDVRYDIFSIIYKMLFDNIQLRL